MLWIYIVVIVLMLAFWFWSNKKEIIVSNKEKEDEIETFDGAVRDIPSPCPRCEHPHQTIPFKSSLLTEYNVNPGGTFVASSAGTHSTSIIGAPFNASY